MKALNQIKEVYFIGIGGIGMSALARYFRRQNKLVSGYDKSPSPLTEALEKEGINIHYHPSVELMGSPDLIIYTPAIPEDFEELKAAQNMEVPLLKRSEMLAEITKNNPSYAIAGTHGKTTISTILAHILWQSKLKCNAFLGGISSNYETNFLFSTAKSAVVLEADEFDRSFHRLSPKMSLVSSVDPDHLDVYEDADRMTEAFQEFIDLNHEDGVSFIHHSLVKKIKPKGRYFTYSLEPGGKFSAQNIKLAEDGYYEFDLKTTTVPVQGLKLGMPGMHNIENAVAASAMAIEAGITELELKKGLESFKGIKRRFEFVIKSPKQVFIDDYAHHPKELDVAIASTRSLYPNKKIVGIFQPHLFSRTRDQFDGFVESLSKLDELILLDIYPARETPIKGISSAALLEKIKLKKKQLLSKEACVEYIAKKKPNLLLSLGAGDISEIVAKLKSALKS